MLFMCYFYSLLFMFITYSLSLHSHQNDQCPGTIYSPNTTKAKGMHMHSIYLHRRKSRPFIQIQHEHDTTLSCIYTHPMCMYYTEQGNATARKDKAHVPSVETLDDTHSQRETAINIK